MDLSKYVSFETREVLRSQIKLAGYNPRKIGDEARKTLKKGIKKFGLVGGIVVNSSTMTLVSGHQRLSVLDDLEKYNPDTFENDYLIKADMIELDEKGEKELSILLNNPNAQGTWDWDKMRAIVPEIDYTAAGLTNADLSMIGLDYLFKTQEEQDSADDLVSLMAEADAEHQAEVEARKEERKAAKEAEKEEEKTYDEKKQHMKDVKEQVRDQVREQAANMDAYVMLSFETFEAKAEFCERFGYDPASKFIKGEDFDSKCEVIYD